MEYEDKILLLKDLCARLPHNVKVVDDLGRCRHLTLGDADLVDLFYSDVSSVVPTIKPYLRPMSSMTKEEDKEWQIYKNNIACAYDENLNERINELYDWFNKHHFDFRGLIEKSLAIAAPKGMYNN